MAEEKARDPTKPEIKPVSIPLSKIHDLPGSVFAPPSPKSLEALTSSIVLKGVQERLSCGSARMASFRSFPATAAVRPVSLRRKQRFPRSSMI